MTFWLTTHWPPREGDTHPVASGAYLQRDLGEVGRDFKAGDIVLVYQARSGPARVQKEANGHVSTLRCKSGRGGVIAICRALGPFAVNEESEVETYTDGSAAHWAWFAPLEVLSMSGFVPREELNRILGYIEHHTLRGFGDKRSGLRKLDESTYLEIEAAFRAGRPAATPVLSPEPRRGGPPGGEGEPHRLLKEYIAGAPTTALGEEGLELTRMEHPFPTGDRADVVLRDRYGRVLGVEIEVHVGDRDLEGFLQALKYRTLLEPLYNREPGDSRAILVAYSITSAMRERFARYGVECHEIAEADVLGWHRREATMALATDVRPPGRGA